MLTPRQASHATAAGPDSWLSLIVDDHIQVEPASAIRMIASATKTGINPVTPEAAFVSLGKLAVAAIILSNAIATNQTISAQKVFIRARGTARKLDERSPLPSITGSATTRISLAAGTFNANAGTRALCMLLIDTIRIANHIAKG